MNIRRAHEKDIPRLIELLEQVLQIHADIRPDIFIPGTTKYTNEELAEMIKDDTKPIYVAADDDDVQYLGKYKLTAYCGCKKCSGKWGTRTASGKKAKQGRTIAVDKRKIKLGSKVQINGKTYVAEDVGGGVKGKHIDVFFKSHKQTKRFGKKTGVKVYKVN